MSEDRVLSAFQSLESALVTGLWEIKAALRAREELKNAVVTSEREKDDRIHILERENKVLRGVVEANLEDPPCIYHDKPREYVDDAGIRGWRHAFLDGSKPCTSPDWCEAMVRLKEVGDAG